MSKKLAGNGIGESSRMMLPQSISRLCSLIRRIKIDASGRNWMNRSGKASIATCNVR
ncbi:hypothetical protein PMJ10TS2_65020 [Paenibacillus melissococcoides]